MEDVIWIAGDFEALLPHCPLKDFLERTWWLHANDFASPLYQVLKLGFEFDRQVTKPCSDAITDDRFYVCSIKQHHDVICHTMDPESSQKVHALVNTGANRINLVSPV